MTDLENLDGTAEPGRLGWRGRGMFFVALAFLAMLASIIPHGGVASAVSGRVLASPFVLSVFFGLWAAVIVEGCLGYLSAPDRMGHALGRLILVTLIPPFRMTITPARPNSHVWLPRFQWLKTGKAAVATMETRTGMTMIAITALIVPVIIADFALGQKPHDVIVEHFDSVARFETSDNQQRLFLLDARERSLTNFVRSERSMTQDIYGDWIVLGKPEGAPTSTLSLSDAGHFSFTTGCAVTEGSIDLSAYTLGFKNIEKTALCPPTWLEIAIYGITALIWLSFALEFIVLVSLAEKKLAFCKKHWINIVIILLPLLAFLRSLQLFRVLRMAKAGKLMRAYRLRGLVTRVAKLATVFNVIDRLMARNPEKYCTHIEEKIREKEEELAELTEKLAVSRARSGASE